MPEIAARYKPVHENGILSLNSVILPGSVWARQNDNAKMNLASKNGICNHTHTGGGERERERERLTYRQCNNSLWNNFDFFCEVDICVVHCTCFLQLHGVVYLD